MDKYLILIIVLLISACNNNNNKTINIAVASNFENTLKLIVKKYKKNHKDININVISGSSGVLTTQILNNAPFDLFLSADTEKPEILYQHQIISPQIYAIGQLVLWIPKFSNSSLCLQELENVTTLAMANPKTAPYGSVAQNILNKNNISIKKTIQTANVSQAYLYTRDNLTQAGFVPYSLIGFGTNGCIQIFQDHKLNQSMILLNNQAKDIYQYILSIEIQLLIQKSGYNIPKPIN